MGPITVTATTGIVIEMTDTQSLQRLLAWLSPAFPVGAFAYSAGLETAIASGTVKNKEQLENWISGSLQHGTARTDAIILAAAHRAGSDSARLTELADLCKALTPAAQRHQEMIVTGSAFIKAASAWPTDILQHLPEPCPYPVAIGAIAAGHNIDVKPTLIATLTAFAHAQISVAVRLVPLGQTDGLKTLAALEPTIDTCAEGAATSTLDDIGSIGYASDIATMAHETLTTRIFRS